MGRVEGIPRVQMFKKVANPDGTNRNLPIHQYSEAQMFNTATDYVRLFKSALIVSAVFQNELKKIAPTISPENYFLVEKDGKGRAPTLRISIRDKKFDISYTGCEESEYLSIKRIYEDNLYDVISVFAGKPIFDDLDAINEGQLTLTNPVTERNGHGKLSTKRVDFYYNDSEAKSAICDVLTQIQG